MRRARAIILLFLNFSLYNNNNKRPRHALRAEAMTLCNEILGWSRYWVWGGICKELVNKYGAGSGGGGGGGGGKGDLGKRRLQNM